ncbi:MAG: T9SS C-terminal target domain-containing protein [Bacteroidetes bacterium]|nr:MAG: T9SS C-terminal target domain-containing protein [Bacteroidota bacterium]
MYMHDGQNLFDAATSFSGEWGIDETLAAKEKTGDKGCIVVGIDNGGGSRLDEYSPYKNPTYGGGDGDLYTQFLTNTLKPYIDANYRTKPEREFTGIAGSSMGAFISLYAAIKQPNTYGKVGIFSPAFWFSDSLRKFVATQTKSQPTQFYFVAGANESLSLIKDMDTMVSTLKAIGFQEHEISTHVKADGAHSEWFWKREFGPCYDWLFSKTTNSTQEIAQLPNNKLNIYPNPARNNFSLNRAADVLILTNQQGKEVARWHKVYPNQQLSLHQVKPGIYFLNIQVGSTSTTEKLVVE